MCDDASASEIGKNWGQMQSRLQDAFTLEGEQFENLRDGFLVCWRVRYRFGDAGARD
jgi:hypothetical protein